MTSPRHHHMICSMPTKNTMHLLPDELFVKLTRGEVMLLFHSFASLKAPHLKLLTCSLCSHSHSFVGQLMLAIFHYHLTNHTVMLYFSRMPQKDYSTRGLIHIIQEWSQTYKERDTLYMREIFANWRARWSLSPLVAVWKKGRKVI